MNFHCKVLHELLSSIQSSNKKLEWAKMSIQEASEVFELLNSRRKGYLNLADIYQVIPECSEEDLFVVFKALDISKTGKVVLNDFISMVGSANTNAMHSESRKDR